MDHYHENFRKFNSRGPINLFLTKILHFDRLFVVIFDQLTDRKNFKTAVMTGPAAFNPFQNPVKFEKFGKMTKT